MKSFVRAIILSVVNAILYVYLVESYFWLTDAPTPRGLVGFALVSFFVLGLIEYFAYLKPYFDLNFVDTDGKNAMVAAKKSHRAWRRRWPVAKKYVKEIYKDELMRSINRGHTSRKFKPARLNSEIDGIAFEDVADMVATHLRDLGYRVDIAPIDISRAEEIYGDVSTSDINDPDWVKTFITQYSDWTVTWDMAGGN